MRIALTDRDMTESISIKNFGPLTDITLDNILPYSFLIGPSGSGKSTFLKTVALMRWIYKMMCIRSYLYYSGVKVSPFSFSFKKHLKLMGMEGFLKDNTCIEYRHGSFSFVYNRKIKLTRKYIPREELSLEKISFVSDKRNLIGDILENNVSLKRRAFYMNETFEDYLLATEAIRSFDMPSLGVRLQVRRTGNGEKHLIEPMAGREFSIRLNESSSGTQSSMPLSVIVEYFSRMYDIVGSLNDAVFRYASKSDSLRDFRASENIGELPNRRVSLFVEEPEISLYPATQRQLLDYIVSRCQSSTEYGMALMVATHSPYIINHLNVLLRRGEDAPHLTASTLGVYEMIDGRIQDLMAEDMDTGEWVVDTSDLSEPMEDIYNEYQSLGV